MGKAVTTETGGRTAKGVVEWLRGEVVEGFEGLRVEG
jgi:hypothetical protein